MFGVLVIAGVLLFWSGDRAAASKPECFGHEATIVGTSTNDTLRGTAGNDVIVGLKGRDDIRPKGGRDLICGGSGGDSVRSVTGSARIKGGTGADFLNGGNKDDVIRGGPGRDEISPGLGSDRVFGGPGKNDNIDFFGGSGLALEVDLKRGVSTGAGEKSLRGIENVMVGSNRAKEVIVRGNKRDNIIEVTQAKHAAVFGGRGSDLLDGHYYGDLLSGGPGNDRLLGTGEDLLIGGHGIDTASFEPLAFPFLSFVKADLEQGLGHFYAPGSSAGGTSILKGIENLSGTEGDDDLTGNTGDNVLEGLGGDDLLTGGEGVDTARGGEGDDTCIAENVSGCEE